MKYAVRASVVLGVIMFAAGCYHQEDNNLVNLSNGMLRFVHAVDDGPTLIFKVRNLERARLEFASASPVQEEIIGDVRVDVEFIDPVTGDEESLLRDVALRTAQDAVVTLIVHGTFASPQSTAIETIRNELATDEFEISYANVSQDSVDIYLTEANELLSNVAPTQTLVNGGFSNAFIDPAKTNYRLRITRENDATVVYDSDTFPVAQGVRTFVMVHESFGPRTDALSVMFADEAGTVPFPNVVDTVAVRALNGVADEASIDVDIADQDTAAPISSSSLVFEELAAFTETDAANVHVAYSVASDPGNVAFELSDFSVGASQFYTFVAGGSAAGQTLTGGFTSRRRLRPTATVGAVQFINASESADDVDVYFLDPGQVPANGVPTGRLIGFLGGFETTLREGAADVYVTQAGTTDVLAGPVQVDIVSRALWLFYVTDAAGGGTPVRFSMFAETPP